jgi:hypothetical protein
MCEDDFTMEEHNDSFEIIDLEAVKKPKRKTIYLLKSIY